MLCLAADRAGTVPALSARETSTGHVLDGVQPHVVDGHNAARILAVARSGDGVGLFEVDAGAVDDLIGVVRDVMEGAAMPAVKIDVPLVVDAGQGANWAEAH